MWKLLLAEGEKVVMVALGPSRSFTAADQGVYAVVSNLGSLVARFAFQPLEEAAYAVFGERCRLILSRTPTFNVQ